MNTKNLKWTLCLAGALAFTACDNDVEHDIPEVGAPSLVEYTPTTSSKVRTGEVEIQVKYDKNVNFVTANLNKLTFTGGKLISAEVYGISNILTVKVNVPTRETACTLTIPEGVVTGPNHMPAPEVTVNFNTVTLQKAPLAATQPAAVALYNSLYNNYGEKTFSGMMANVAWNHECADQVFEWTGKHPAINTYDFVHMPASEAGANWINYRDITPVSEWAAAGGIVSCMWHWLVPKFAPVAEDLRVKVWESEAVNMGNWEGNIQLTTAAEADLSMFDQAVEGDYLIVKVEQDATQGWWQGSLKNTGWSELAEGSNVIEMTAGATQYAFLLSQAAIDEIKTNGFIISGCNHKVLSVHLGTPATVYDPNEDYTYKPEETSFNAKNALTAGTWENDVYKKDMQTVIEYLKQLQDANIAVLWRPFHEAEGAWFWWGSKDADTFKALWIDMFNQFKSAGLNNLIWVYTAEDVTDTWYPGDEYVDIVGRDLYNKDNAEDCATEFNNFSWYYGDKIMTLSECGTVAPISEQWGKGARWSWFMPWYSEADGDGSVIHADQNWWIDAMSQDYVISREDLIQ